jgi:fucose 4-O-acetylase-like acetyltransferase
MSRADAAPAPAGSTRYAAVDYLKALAIVAVSFQHAGPFLFSTATTPLDVFLRNGLTTFHVPTFLVVSGFLYSRGTPQGLAQVGHRLRRFLVPYFFASLVALALHFSSWHTAWDALRCLLLGSALGIYYYIFLITCFTLTIWPLSRLPRAGVLALLGGFCVYVLLVTYVVALGPPLSPFWDARDPRHFAGYFLCGWVAAAYLPELDRAVARFRAPIVAVACLGLAAWLAVILGVELLDYSIMRAVYTLSVVCLVVLATRGRAVPRVVSFLSNATLTLYLYHAMFELKLLHAAMVLPPALRIPLLSLAGLLLASALLLLARRLLGARTRWLLGA